MKRTKMFGAERITTDEMNQVYEEIVGLVGNQFAHMEMSQPLPSKVDHGDIDILVHCESDPIVTLRQSLNDQLLELRSNGTVKSILLNSFRLNRAVHVDFITSGSYSAHRIKCQYFRLSDFSFAVGLVAKKLHFKYGSEGFFKRFQDKRTVWRDILISEDLDIGLKILGYSPAAVNDIRDNDDIVRFLQNSPLFDSGYWNKDKLAADDRQTFNMRSDADYIHQRLIRTDQRRSIDNEDYFLMTLYRPLYDMVEDEKIRLNSVLSERERYSGHWLMEKFGMQPGPEIGRVIGLMKKNLPNLPDMEEQQVIDFIQPILQGK